MPACGHTDLYADGRCRPCRRVAASGYYEKNRPEIRARVKQKRRTRTNVHLWSLARTRARKRGLEFTLLPEDVVIPALCPVLGIRIDLDDRYGGQPTLDRVDNSKGYTRENVRVISNRANVLKRDATVDEVAAVLRYMREHRA